MMMLGAEVDCCCWSLEYFFIMLPGFKILPILEGGNTGEGNECKIFLFSKLLNYDNT